MRFASVEAMANGMLLSLRRCLGDGALPRLARFEIRRRKDAAAGILVRPRRPGNRVRHWLHERHRSHRGPLLPRPAHRPPRRRARLPWRLSRSPGRVRPAKALPRTRPCEPLRVSPQGARALPRGGPLPPRRSLARPAIPRGAGTDPGRKVVLHHRGGPRVGRDGGEPGRGAPSVLRPVQAGGPGGRGGAESPEGRSGEDGRHPGGASGVTGPGQGGTASGRGDRAGESSPR